MKKHLQGKNLLKYDQNQTPTKTKTLPHLLKKAEAVINALRKIDHRMRFPRATVRAAMSSLGDILKQQKLITDPVFLEDWIETNTRRVLNVSRVTSQAMLKARKNVETDRNGCNFWTAK